jgi:hypothetical protein
VHAFDVAVADLAFKFAPQLMHCVLSELQEQPCALQRVQNKPCDDFGVALSCWAFAICALIINASTAASVETVSLINISRFF